MAGEDAIKVNNYFVFRGDEKDKIAVLKKKLGQAKKMHAVQQSDDDELFLGSVEVDTCIKKIDSAEMDDDDWTQDLIINRRNVTFNLDTGAKCNVMSAQTFNALDIKGKRTKSTCKLVAYFGQTAPLGKKKSLTCVYKGQKHKIKFEIVEQHVPAILGKATCIKLGLVKRVYGVDTKKRC